MSLSPSKHFEEFSIQLASGERLLGNWVNEKFIEFSIIRIFTML